MSICKFCKREVDIKIDVKGKKGNWAHSGCLSDGIKLFNKLKKILQREGYIKKED